MANARIIDIPTIAQSPASDDYIELDGVTNGSRRLNLSTFSAGSNNLIAPFALRQAGWLTNAEWAKGVKMLFTRNTSPAIALQTTTGYCKGLRWDGTFTAVNGTGAPSLIFLNWGAPPVSPYDAVLPKFAAVFPTDVAGNITGDIFNLTCNNTYLTALDLAGLTAMVTIQCSNNDITYLDLAGMTAVQEFYCDDNRLTSLDVSDMTSLRYFQCAGNVLRSLDVSGLTQLDYMYCVDNQITSLRCVGVNGNPYTSYAGLDWQNNLLDANALNQAYTDLANAEIPGTMIDVTGNPGVGGSDPTIATNKGYVVVS